MQSENLVSIVIPTRNEEKNIRTLCEAIVRVAIQTHYEILVVDDSEDKTAEVAKAMGCRVVRGKRQGLGQAIIDGIAAAKGDIVLVMDADMSHDPQAIPDILYPILFNGCDMSIGSRYVKNGEIAGWNLRRRIISRVACLLALPLTRIKDATSGFFAFRKEIIKGKQIEPRSWKIMLEILLKTKPAAVKEVPVKFTDRQEGESKFNQQQTIAYAKHLWQLTLYRYRRFIRFCIVGGSGTLMHLAIVWIMTEAVGLWYMFSICIAVAIVVTWNFTLNSLWTFSHEKNPDDHDYDWYGYHKGNPAQKWWKRSIAKTVWRWIPSSSTMLDIGCGTSPIITQYPNAIGIDTNSQKLRFMRKLLPKQKFLKAKEGCSLKFNSNSFDYVICIEVLEHLKNPDRMIQEIARVLKPKGQTILATPDYNRLWWYIAEFFTPTREQHISKFSRKKLEEACSKYGLTPVQHKYVLGCDLIEMFEKA
jgi:dolichol-phosphate mannosyltransferase